MSMTGMKNDDPEVESLKQEDKVSTPRKHGRGMWKRGHEGWGELLK